MIGNILDTVICGMAFALVNEGSREALNLAAIANYSEVWPAGPHPMFVK